MMSVVVVIAIVCFAIGLRIYGKWLTNYFLSDKTEEMPAVYLRDDMDYFPSPFSMLFAHHFSSIAGAGAIIGPVAAGAMFGWVPALLWIVFRFDFTCCCCNCNCIYIKKQSVNS